MLDRYLSLACSLRSEVRSTDPVERLRPAGALPRWVIGISKWSGRRYFLICQIIPFFVGRE